MRATNAENVLTASVSANAADIAANNNTLDAKIDQEISDRQVALTDERTYVDGEIATINTTISNLLSNTSPEAIDSISEIVGQLNNLSAEDSNIAGLISALTTRVTDLESIVNTLTQNN